MPIVGKCYNMCPGHELQMRQKEKLLHPLEILHGTENSVNPKADPYRTVKSFSRSAAGVDLSSPDNLRPAKVLIKTVKYLLTQVINDSRFSELSKYDFIVDRLRAVQQDMVIQCLPPCDSIQILEPIVFFHTLFGYRLSTEHISKYDPVLNKKQLLEYLKRLLVCYDEIEFNEKPYNMNTTKDYVDDKSMKQRSLIESIYIMCNLGDLNPLERYLKLNRVYKSSIKTCFKISLCHLSRNWVRQCMLLKKISPLALCAGILYLPEIRRNAYQVMCHAYNSKILRFPADKLSEILLHNNMVELTEECNYYNIDVTGGQLAFKKDSFRFKESYPYSKLKFVDEVTCDVNLIEN